MMRRKIGVYGAAATAACWVSLLAGCDQSPANGQAHAADTANVANVTATAEPAATVNRRSDTALAEETGSRSVQCPASLSAGYVAPTGARLIGTPSQALPLGIAILAMEAPNEVSATLSPLGEVETEMGEEEAGLRVEYATAQSTPALPLTLICEYGDMLPGQRYTATMLLLPLVPGNDYECTFKTPQGKSRKPASGVCGPRADE